MEKLPLEVINKIFFFTSHPVADIFKTYLEITEVTSTQDRQIDIDILEYCDCCACKWSECSCWCSSCSGRYCICRYSCYGER